MSTAPIPAEAVLLDAASLVGGDRAAQHGPKLPNHQKIAEVWNGILAAAGKRPISPLDAHDVANLMEGLKIARRYTGGLNRDDYVDGAGYAGVAFEIKQEMERVTGSWAKDAKVISLAEDDGA